MGRHPASSEQIILDTANRYQSRHLSEVVKFTALAAMLAIFFDAAIGHAMIWGNDPYWTYWVTDTLLMATVFGLGTMWLGMGLGRGALITGIHVTLLTVYYWTLSPIGLPSHAEWLDIEHTWVTGLPVHLAVYYLGYVTALWLWNRRTTAKHHIQQQSQSSLLPAGVAVLAATAAIVVITGIVQTIAFQEFPGVTWFIVRIAIAFPFSIAWWMMAGTDRADPQGRFTTRQGVAFGKWHGGRSGIGLAELPPIYSNVLAFALASILAEGRLIASGVPVQVMATRRDTQRLVLQVGHPLERSAGIPNGAFRVAWRDFTGGHSSASKYARYVFGGAVLFVLLAFAWGVARRELDPNGQIGIDQIGPVSDEVIRFLAAV